MKKRSIYTSTILTAALASALIINDPVNARSTALKLNKTKLTVKIGKKKSILIKGSKKKITWKSSNTKIAAVSSKGSVTGIKKGTATITATAGKQHATCKITIIGKNDYSSVLTEKKIRKVLNVPKKAKIIIKYGKTFYKDSFVATLVPVDVYEQGKKVAGAAFFVKNGDLGCNVAQYGTYS